jgi:hypothetical protein
MFAHIAYIVTCCHFDFLEKIMLLITSFGSTGAEPEMTWLYWGVGLFFILMVLVGWLSSRRKKEQDNSGKDQDPSH